MSKSNVNVGVIGLGFMGSTHIKAFKSAATDGRPCQLTAVADQNPDRLTGKPWSGGNIVVGDEAEPLFDPDAVRAYTDPVDLIGDPAVDLVSICTHTSTHVDLAIAALQAGKHVIVEKPIAVDPMEAERLAAAAASADTLCMPAMCMRFWPGWSWLKETIDSGRFGGVTSAVFQRLGSRPRWSGGFYEDDKLSGGALFDLHVHDADFIYWCFGPPRVVSSVGTLNHVCTQYRYGDAGSHAGPPLVVAEGGWGHAANFGFRMRFVVNFERATADFDLARSSPLVLHTEQDSTDVPLPSGLGYDHQARAMVDAIVAGGPSPIDVSEAAAVIRMVHVERRSLEEGREISPN